MNVLPRSWDPLRNSQYLDPRWQKKRLEIMDRAGFACEWCGENTRTLHIHHGYYAKYGYREPWNYPDDSLYCFCDGCHEQAEDLKHDIHLEIGRTHPRYHVMLFNLILAFGRQMKGEPDLWTGFDEGDYDEMPYDEMPYDDFGDYPHDDFDGNHFDDQPYDEEMPL